MVRGTIVMDSALEARGMGLPITMVRALLAGLVATALSIAAVPRSVWGQAPSIQLNGGTPILIVAESIAGSSPSPAAENATSITISTAQTSSLLVALDGGLPAGVTLRIKIEAPAGAMSMGFVPLDSTPQEVVRGIAPGFYPGLTISYELIAQTPAGTVAASSCAVTFSLTAES